jgi:Ca2+-binding RTX toxin-like protein
MCKRAENRQNGHLGHSKEGTRPRVICADCGKVKAPEEFPRNRNRKSGRYSYCKPCHNVRGRESVRRLYGNSRHYHLRQKYGVGKRGRDRLFGRDDDDFLYGGDGRDRLLAGIDDDLLEGGSGRDVLVAGVGNDVLDGGAGRDVCLGSRRQDVFRSCEVKR